MDAMLLPDLTDNILWRPVSSYPVSRSTEYMITDTSIDCVRRNSLQSLRPFCVLGMQYLVAAVSEFSLVGWFCHRHLLLTSVSEGVVHRTHQHSKAIT